MNPVAVVAVGAAAVAGAAARRRRKRLEAELTRGEWQPGEFPSRDELAARRRRRRDTFRSGVEFTMGATREWWPGGHSRWGPGRP
jgi:hypothetical protein